MERSTHLAQALPGLVISLSLIYVTEHYLFALCLTRHELVLAGAIVFFPPALVAVRAGGAHAPPGFEEVALSLGRRRLSVLLRVTLPILAAALVAGFALVFLSASTGLTATLTLVPTGVNALATGFWSFTSDFAHGGSAPYPLALAVIAGVLLARWCERTPGPART